MKLNLACGSTCWPGFENSDINGEPHVIHLDLEQFPYPYPDDCAELVLLSHALQMTFDGTRPVHPDLKPIMAEIYRVICPGGWLRIDDNPLRIYDANDDVSDAEIYAESLRGFPEGLCFPRKNLSKILYDVGFRQVVHIDPNDTQIRADEATTEAIVGNHLDHFSFALEAQK